MCFFEIGDGKGTLLQFDYDHPPRAAEAEPALAPGQDRLQQDVLAHGPQGQGLRSRRPAEEAGRRSYTQGTRTGRIKPGVGPIGTVIPSGLRGPRLTRSCRGGAMSRIPGGRRAIAGFLASFLLMALTIVPGSPIRATVVSADPRCRSVASWSGDRESGHPAVLPDIDLSRTTSQRRVRRRSRRLGAGRPGVLVRRVRPGRERTMQATDCAGDSTITIDVYEIRRARANTTR